MRFITAIIFLLVSAQCFGFTVEEYYSLAPELLSGMANVYLGFYTVSTGSLIAFYLFGWNSAYFIRFIAGLFFIWMLDASMYQYQKLLHTQYEAFYRYLMSNDLCSPEEPFKTLYEKAQNLRCSPELLALPQQQRQEMVLEILYPFVGLGFSEAKVSDSAYLGQNLLALNFNNFWNGAITSITILIWFLCPPRSYFVKKGWIKES